MLALGVVGAGYAAWTSNLTINATLETGTLSWAFLDVVPLSGFTTAQLTQETYSDGDTVVAVTAENTYPGWKGYLTIDEKNTGTLPLRFESFKFQSTGGTGFAGYYQVAFYYATPAFTSGPAVVDVNNCNYAAYISTIDGTEITYSGLGITVDLPAGAHNPSIISLYLHPDVPMEWMNIPYTFTFTHKATVALP